MEVIDTIIDFITKKPEMAAIGWLATVLGLIVAVVTPIITKKKKKLAFGYTTTQLVEAEVAKVNNIKILFHEEPIERLSVTKFTIRNTGNTIVRADNMFPDHDLKVISNDINIISVIIEKVSRDIVTTKKEIAPISQSLEKPDEKDQSSHNQSLEKPDEKDQRSHEQNSKQLLIPIPFFAFEKKDYMVLSIYHTGGTDTKFRLDGEAEDLRIGEDNVYENIKKNILESGRITFPAISRLYVRSILKTLVTLWV